MTEDVARRDIDIVRVRLFDLVDVGLDVLHVGEIFHRTFFAGSDDQPLFTYAQRHLGLAEAGSQPAWEAQPPCSIRETFGSG